MFEYVKDLGLKPARAYIKRKKTDAIVLHHFASSATPEQVHAAHIKKGNRGIDYNIVVLIDGTVVWGRGLEAAGGHTKEKYGYNARSIGIACQGNFEVNQMGNAQKIALLRVIADCLVVYPAIKEITPHKDISATACPGKYFPLAEAQAFLYQDVAPVPAPAAPPAAFAVDRLLKLTYTVTANNLNARKGPSIIHTIIGKLVRGNVLTYQGSKGAWTLTNRGWVSSAYIKRNEYMRGEDVKAIQRALKAADYDPGAIDGVYGAKTAEAALAYQKANGLAADAIAGPQVVRALGGTWKA